MDILFVATSTYNDFFAQEWHPDQRYTVAYLRRHQINAGYCYIPVLEQPEQLLGQKGESPDRLFIELTEENCTPIFRFLQHYKEISPQTIIFAGGVPVNFSPKQSLEEHPEIDYIVTGERELTLLETLRRMKCGESLSNVPGLQSRDFTNPPHPFISNLDQLGHMIQDGFANMLAGQAPSARTAHLTSSRGCYARCSFCGVSDYFRSPGPAWRGRSASAIVEEIEELHNRFEISRFIFEDDEFFGPGPRGQVRAKEIATEILARKLKIEYFLCCRLNDIQVATLNRLKEAGLSGIGLSVESTNQASLNLLQKGIKVEAIYPTLQLIEELEIPCQVNLIFFDPYLTLPGVRSNLTLLEYLRDSKYLSYSSAFPFNELKPFPWSRVADQLRTEGLLNESNATCLFKDDKVSHLAHFARQIKQRLPLSFKKRLLFDGLDSLPGKTQSTARLEVLTQVANGLRHWVGLTLLPRYMSIACDILEQNEKNPSGRANQISLDELDEQFADEVKTLQGFEQNLGRALAITPD